MDSHPIGFSPMTTPSLKNPSLQNTKQSEETKLREAAEGFEGYFIYTLFKEMQKTTPKGSLFGSGSGGEIYEHLFHQALADKLAGENGLGLTKMLIDHLREKEGRLKKADERNTTKPLGVIGR